LGQDRFCASAAAKFAAPAKDWVVSQACLPTPPQREETRSNRSWVNEFGKSFFWNSWCGCEGKGDPGFDTSLEVKKSGFYHDNVN